MRGNPPWPFRMGRTGFKQGCLALWPHLLPGIAVRYPATGANYRIIKNSSATAKWGAVQIPNGDYNGNFSLGLLARIVYRTVYRTVYRHAFFVPICTSKTLILLVGVGLHNGFHAVDGGSNPPGDAKNSHGLPSVAFRLAGGCVPTLCTGPSDDNSIRRSFFCFTAYRTV